MVNFRQIVAMGNDALSNSTLYSDDVSVIRNLNWANNTVVLSINGTNKDRFVFDCGAPGHYYQNQSCFIFCQSKHACTKLELRCNVECNIDCDPYASDEDDGIDCPLVIDGNYSYIGLTWHPTHGPTYNPTYNPTYYPTDHPTLMPTRKKSVQNKSYLVMWIAITGAISFYNYCDLVVYIQSWRLPK